jgi:DNA-binding transcriptional MerR regulator
MSAKKGLKGAELCRTLDIQPYVLRYWETEFRALQAPTGGGAQRTYSDADVALVRRIKQLLYEEGYTIAGAKKKLESEPLEATPRAETAALFEPTPNAETAAVDPRPRSALDTASAERIEQLRRGIESALADAKSVLGILDRHPH